MSSPVLRHPYLDHEPGQPLSACRISDALDSASASLWLLADLFVGPADKCEILNSDRTRVGMFNQLATVANTLEVLSARISTEGKP